jgi:hypothetical protein
MGVINSKHLDLAHKREEFLAAAPFPHLVLDDFLEADFFAGIKDIFEDISASTGKTFTSAVEEKKWISLNSDLPGAIRQVVDALNTPEWRKNMTALTGLPSLTSTSNDNTKLANYHIMESGAILGPHVDHSYEPTTGLPHVLNVIVYLTEAWDESWGGATYFYDDKGKDVVARVACAPNRAAVFLHTPYSFHGVERVDRETKVRRRTIYVDYYSESYKPYADLDLRFDTKWFRHGTTFKLSSYADYLRPKNRNYTKAMLQYHLMRLARKFG